jgi:transposase
MVHVHGVQVQRLVEGTRGVPLEQLLVVPIDVGKQQAMALVGDFTGELLVRRFRFPMTRAGVAQLVGRVHQICALRPVRLVRVGVEAAGHYHRPLTSVGVLPAAWQVVELNPAQVTAQRRVNGQRGVKTDPVDLAAISDLLVAGRGIVVGHLDQTMGEVVGLVAHRHRRVQVRTATKNQLLGQADRCFPGLSGCLSSLLDTRVGRLLVAEFCDPARLARLGACRFQAFAARRGIIVRAALAQRLVDAAHQAIPTDQADIARGVLADDLALLERLDTQIAAIDQRLEVLVAATAFAVLCSVPGWATIRVARYGAAVGDLGRWPSARQLYRAAGLPPILYESSGRRRDGAISREGSVVLRRALVDLGVGLWHCDPPARAYAASLRARGKPGGVIACALAHRANRIAYALVRDQAVYDPTRWR